MDEKQIIKKMHDMQQRIEILEQQIRLDTGHDHRINSTSKFFRRSRNRRFVMALVALSVLVSTATVFSQVTTDCATDLFCFSPNSPAKASEVNSNFAILKNWVVEKIGDVPSDSVDITGNVTVTKPDDAIAQVSVMGSTSQGTGMVYVGQSSVYGGGVAYNGDNDPVMTYGTDRITYFRRNDGVDAEVFSHSYADNNVRFTGGVSVSGNGTFSGVMSYPGQNVGGGYENRTGNSATRLSCSSWGSATCSSGNAVQCPSGTTINTAFAGHCYPDRYCFSFNCIRN